MLSELTMLSLASAVVQYNFRIEHSGLNERNAQHSVHRRAIQTNETNYNTTNGNSTVQPLINASLTTGYNFYHGAINVGSPAQEIEVLLDTGSPVSWVYGYQGSYNNATRFFSNQSSTYTKLNHSFSASYGSGQYLGSWGEDYVSSPQFVESDVVRYANSSNANSTRVPFDFGMVSNFATLAGAPGLLGLGPHIDNAGPEGYMTLPEAYYHNNITSSPAFSVFLEKDEGRFLFGSVDTQYFQPPLYQYCPKTSLTGSPYGRSGSKSKPTSWTVFLDGATLNHGADYIVRSNVVLDTGSPVSLLPPGFVNAVGRSLGLTKYGKYETWYVNSTSNALPNGTITFNFNGFKIDADIANFLVPGQYIWLDDGPQNVTALALMGSPNYLLGDAFFRSAYTVFDPSTHGVMLAQRTTLKMNSTNTTNGSTIIPINQLLNNSTAIVNGTNVNTTSSIAATTTSPSYQAVSTSLAEDDGVTTTVIVIAANQYLGTVDAEKAALMTATQSESSQTSSTASTVSPTSAAASTSTAKTSSAKASSNSGSVVATSTSFVWGLMATVVLATI